MIPILPSSAVKSRFDALHGCIRPDWESGLDMPCIKSSLSTNSRIVRFQGSILIHCHVFYPSLLPDLVRSWQHIPNRQVVITTSLTHIIPALERIMSSLEQCQYEIRSVPNRGRDIAPMLFACRPYLLGETDLVLHCHTKRSVHVNHSFATGWRESMIQATFSPEVTSQCILPLFSQPSTALIFPWPHHFVAHNVNWGLNYRACAAVMNAIGYDLKRYTYLYFPAGSFFWMRASLLKPLLDLNMHYRDFAPEPLPNDGCLAHAMERILGLLPYHLQKRSYAVWSGAESHGMRVGSPFKALVAMPTLQELGHGLKDCFKRGLELAQNGECYLF